MKEELLHRYLFGNYVVGVAIPGHSFHLALQFHHLHVRLEDGLVAYHPYHFVYDTMFWRTFLCGERVLRELGCRIGVAAGVGSDAYEECRSSECRQYYVALFSHVCIYINMYSVSHGA